MSEHTNIGSSNGVSFGIGLSLCPSKGWWRVSEQKWEKAQNINVRKGSYKLTNLLFFFFLFFRKQDFHLTWFCFSVYSILIYECLDIRTGKKDKNTKFGHFAVYNITFKFNVFFIKLIINSTSQNSYKINLNSISQKISLL